MIYVAVGLVAGVFSLVLGLIYVFGLDAIVPDMDSILAFRFTPRRWFPAS